MSPTPAAASGLTPNVGIGYGWLLACKSGVASHRLGIVFNPIGCVWLDPPVWGIGYGWLLACKSGTASHRLGIRWALPLCGGWVAREP